MEDALTEEVEQGSKNFAPGYVLHDRYEIKKALGAGGFAVVYAAFDRTIERKVAIKVLNLYAMVGSQSETDEILQRFLREARVAAKIRHPSSIEIYDFGVLKGGKRPYIIMEFLQGWDLDEELQERGPLNSERLFPLFCSALDALAEAHEKGVIHKDLKPANLFWSQPDTEQELLKVVDFGIAHVNAPGKERLTQTGVMSGTPEYLPPEYVEEQSVTEKLDIYQMGLTLVEALSGVPVVQAASPYQAAFKHVKQELNIPPEFKQGDFGELLKRALAKEPDERFESAAAFSEALAAIDPATVSLASLADTQRVPGPPALIAEGLWEESEADTAIEPVAEIDEDAPTTRIKREMAQFGSHSEADLDVDESSETEVDIDVDADDTEIEPMTMAEMEAVETVKLAADGPGDEDGADDDSAPETIQPARPTHPTEPTATNEPPEPIERPVGDSSEGLSTSKLKVAAGVSVAVMVVLIVLVAMVVLDDDDEELLHFDDEVELVAETDEQPPVGEEEEQADQDPQIHSVEVITIPSDVDITDGNGDFLGNSPLAVDIPDGDEVSLRLSREDYETKEVTLDAASGEEVTFELHESL